MNWTIEAEEEIKKVPFFVRKKVKKRVEKEALEDNKKIVTISEVRLTQKRFLSNMSKEVKGYQIENCFAGCPNGVNNSEGLIEKLQSLFEEEDILGFLKESVDGDLKFHHDFRVTVAECPNGCSQPQIKDIGIIGAFVPSVSEEECSMCSMCIDTCKENAIELNSEKNIPEIDMDLCLYCGACEKVCPTGTIIKKMAGYRVQIGGKLGRHPRLAKELKGIFSEEEVVEIVKKCVRFYKKNSVGGKRFSMLLMERDISEIGL
jgi:dissimilatory sulfite reductase (desulfoviridin) alpha/beta subunit